MDTLSLGFKIRKIRELKNLTQEHVAQSLGISQAAYSKLERGESDFQMEKIQRISEILGVSIIDLFSFDERVVYNIMHNQTGIQSNIVHQRNENSEELIRRIVELEREVRYLKEIVSIQQR